MSTPAIVVPGYVIGEWDIDTVHSDVSITARHFMISKVRGHFTKFSGAVITAENPLNSSVTAIIDAASINTGNDQRDDHIRSEDFLDVQNHPQIRFISTGIYASGDNFALRGNLTLRGITRPITLEVELTGFGPDAFGGTRAGFSARGSVDRKDFGVSFSAILEGGGAVVGDTLDVALEIEAVLRRRQQ